MQSTPYVISHGEITAARQRCAARGLPDPGSIRIARARQFWDRECPGHGRTIADMLEPFYSCAGWFPLAPTSADIDDAARTAVFWREVVGAVPVVRLDAALAAMGTGFHAKPTEAFAALPGSLMLEVAESKRDTLGNYLWQTLPKSLWDEIGSSMWLGIERYFDDSEREHAFDWVWGALARTLFVAVAHALTDETEAVQPMLDLWLRGLWPLGFTEDRALLLMCAEVARPAEVGTHIDSDIDYFASADVTSTAAGS